MDVSRPQSELGPIQRIWGKGEGDVWRSPHERPQEVRSFLLGGQGESRLKTKWVAGEA